MPGASWLKNSHAIGAGLGTAATEVRTARRRFCLDLEYNPGAYGEAKSEENRQEEDPLAQDPGERPCKAA